MKIEVNKQYILNLNLEELEVIRIALNDFIKSGMPPNASIKDISNKLHHEIFCCLKENNA